MTDRNPVDPHHDLIERANEVLGDIWARVPTDADHKTMALIRELRDALAERAAMPTREIEQLR